MQNNERTMAPFSSGGVGSATYSTVWETGSTGEHAGTHSHIPIGTAAQTDDMSATAAATSTVSDQDAGETDSGGERAGGPFLCTEPSCLKNFASAFSLKRHIAAIHNRDRPFVCQFPNCGKTYVSASNLNTHMRVHNNDRPHHCPYEGCNKSFTAHSTLTTHLLTHTGERPFLCSYQDCGKSFTRSGHLLVHIRSVHERRLSQPFEHGGKPVKRASMPDGATKATQLRRQRSMPRESDLSSSGNLPASSRDSGSSESLWSGGVQSGESGGSGAPELHRRVSALQAAEGGAGYGAGIASDSVPSPLRRGGSLPDVRPAMPERSAELPVQRFRQESRFSVLGGGDPWHAYAAAQPSWATQAPALQHTQLQAPPPQPPQPQPQQVRYQHLGGGGGIDDRTGAGGSILYAPRYAMSTSVPELVGMGHGDRLGSAATDQSSYHHLSGLHGGVGITRSTSYTRSPSIPAGSWHTVQHSPLTGQHTAPWPGAATALYGANTSGSSGGGHVAHHAYLMGDGLARRESAPLARPGVPRGGTGVAALLDNRMAVATATTYPQPLPTQQQAQDLRHMSLDGNVHNIAAGWPQPQHRSSAPDPREYPHQGQYR